VFKKARTAAKAHEIIENHFSYELKGQRKTIFKKVVNACYPQGMNEFSIAFSFMLVQLDTLTDDYSIEKERWVNRMCNKMSGLILDAEGLSGGGVDPFDILREQRDRFNPKPTTSPKTESKAKAKRKADTYDWDNYYEQLIELNGCGPTIAQTIISKVQTERELTDREYAFWDQVE
jgi:hypothetical protein